MENWPDIDGLKVERFVVYRAKNRIELIYYFLKYLVIKVMDYRQKKFIIGFFNPSNIVIFDKQICQVLVILS